MRQFSIRRPLLWSPLIALVAQLVLATAAAACTNGGNFPLIQR